jgi:hypothetical protein
VKHLVFLLEESSAKAFLDGYLQRILPANVTFQTIPHQGKSDLQKSIPRKLRAWRAPNTYFIVLHDQDANVCTDLKEQLIKLCEENGRPNTLVRIACRELAAWYFGDLEAIAAAYHNFTLEQYVKKAKYRDPDAIVSPSRELMKLVSSFQKVSGARIIAPHISRERNTSHSFQTFLTGVERLLEDECT